MKRNVATKLLLFSSNNLEQHKLYQVYCEVSPYRLKACRFLSVLTSLKSRKYAKPVVATMYLFFLWHFSPFS